MQKLTAKQARGFTMIELIVVIVIMGILAAVSSKAIQAGFNSYYTGQDLTTANWLGRLALENMERNIHAVRSPADITTASSTQLIFTDESNNTNNYTFTLATKLLQYNFQGLGLQTLANNVSSFAFTYYDKTGTALTPTPLTAAQILTLRYVTINFTITFNNVIYTFRTTVNPLNLNPAP